MGKLNSNLLGILRVQSASEGRLQSILMKVMSRSTFKQLTIKQPVPNQCSGVNYPLSWLNRLRRMCDRNAKPQNRRRYGQGVLATTLFLSGSLLTTPTDARKLINNDPSYPAPMTPRESTRDHFWGQNDQIAQGLANDLEVTKTVSNATPFEGGATVYTITATNVGTNPLTGIQVRDNLPLSVLHTGHFATQGTYDLASGIWTVGNLANGDSATLTLTVVIFSGTAGDTITNTASLEQLDQTDTNAANNTDSVDIIPLSTGGGIPPAIEPINVCFPIADSGGSNGGNDRLTRLNKLTRVENGIGPGTGTNNIEGGALQPGTGIFYTVDGNRLGTLDFETGEFTGYSSTISSVSGFRRNSGNSFTVNGIDVDGMSFDPTTGILYGALRRTGNNRDLLIQIDIATGDHVPNAFLNGTADFVEIDITNGLRDIDGIAVNIDGRLYGVANNGSSGQQRLVEIDKFTGATTSVGLVGNGLDLEGLSFDFQGNLYATSGARSELYQLNPLTGAIIDTWDLSVGGDYEAVSCLLSSSDLRLLKNVDNGTPAPNGTINYTLAITNNGASVASGVEVTDNLPAGVTYSSDSASQGSYDSSSGIWQVGVLEVGESATLQIAVTVDPDASGSLTNNATISNLDQPDNNPNNNADDAAINVITGSDYGDAPTSLTSIDASLSNIYASASHELDGLTYLGNLVDADPANQPSVNADGDDTNGSPNDEDGVTFPLAGNTRVLSAGQSNSLTIQASRNGILNAWIDWNQDGDWTDPNEQLATDVTLTAGDNTLTVTVPTPHPMVSPTLASGSVPLLDSDQ